MSQPGRGRARGGFTLLELVIAIGIMTVLVGAAVPVTSKVLTHRARKATTDQLHELSEASAAFFRDVGRLPTQLRELLIDPGTASAPGWSGPYLAGVVADQITGLTGYEVDAWSRTYRTRNSQSRLAIESRGEDNTWDTADDISIELDVTPIRRELTLERLRIVNNAIQIYNQLYQATEPLPGNYPIVYQALVAKGLLPMDDDFLYDGWGSVFVESPPGQSPVVRLSSRNFIPELAEPQLQNALPFGSTAPDAFGPPVPVGGLEQLLGILPDPLQQRVIERPLGN